VVYTCVEWKNRRTGKNMRYSELCHELNKFIEGEIPLATIKDCFSLYWSSVDEQGNHENNIAQVELLHIAVEAYESGWFSKEDLRETFVHYSSEVNYHPHGVNEDRTKNHG
jgi:hypothetical protein